MIHMLHKRLFSGLLHKDDFHCKEIKVSSNKEKSTYLFTTIYKHKNTRINRQTDRQAGAPHMFICNPVHKSRYNLLYISTYHHDSISNEFPTCLVCLSTLRNHGAHFPFLLSWKKLANVIISGKTF